MVFENEDEYLKLIENHDASQTGIAHYYSKYISNLINENNTAKEIAAHNMLLKVLWNKYASPDKIIKELAPAVLYEVIHAMKRLYDLNQKIKDTVLEQNQNDFIKSLIAHYGGFLKDYKTNADAIQYFIDFDDNQWVQYIHLFGLILAYPNCTADNKRLAERMREIQLVLEDKEKRAAFINRNTIAKVESKQDAVVITSTSCANSSANSNKKADVEQESDDGDNESRNNINDAEELSTQPLNKKKNKKHKKSKAKASLKEQDSTKEEELNPIIKILLKLNPTEDVLKNDKWIDFFKRLADGVSLAMPYQNKAIESADLLTHANNEAAFNQLVLDALAYLQVKYQPSDKTPNKELMLYVTSRFNNQCIQLKHAPITIDMNAVRAIFEVQCLSLWAARARSLKTKNFFFNQIFPVDYMQQLNSNQLAKVRKEFEKVTAQFIGLAHRAQVIDFCVNKICPNDVYDQTLSDRPVTTVQYLTVQSNSRQGEFSPAWEKFITKVYNPFNEKNPNRILWDPNLNDEQKKEKLKPLLEQFHKHYPNINEKAQAQGKFLSFIGDANDCLFAKNAEDYAFLFIKLMVPGKEVDAQRSISEVKKLRHDLFDIKSELMTTLSANK